MADYDCEYCKLSKNRSGRCERWEYNCPFAFLENKVDTDIEKLNLIKSKLKECIDIFNTIENKYSFEEVKNNISFALNNLEDNFLNEELYKEWQEINRPIENRVELLQFLSEMKNGDILNIGEIKNISRDYSIICKPLLEEDVLVKTFAIKMEDGFKFFDAIEEFMEKVTELDIDLNGDLVGMTYKMANVDKLK